MTDTNALGPWECFQDASYYDMWCVRRVHDRTFGQGFHLVQGEEAAGLRDLLNTRATDEHPTANEVWEARLGDLRDKAENWQNRAERAEQALAERDAEIVRLRAVMERCANIVKANNWRQNEKVDDVPLLIERALKTTGGSDANNTGEEQ